MEPLATDLENPTPEPEMDIDTERLVKALVDEFELQEQPYRDNHLRLWRKLDYLWRGIQYYYWSEVAHDYRTLDDSIARDISGMDPSQSDKIINVYRANGEIWISALSTQVPYVQFFPDDAENPDDVSTAKVYSKVAQLIQKHNEARMLLAEALFILWNQGLVCAYSYSEEDKAYGIVKEEVFKETTVQTPTPVCSNCGVDFTEQGCPQCGNTEPTIEARESVITKLDHVNELAKSRQRIEIYGPLHVAIPHSARNDKEIGILVLKVEKDEAEMRARFPEKARDIQGSSDSYTHDRWARTNTPFGATSNLVTVRQVWLLPYMYWRLGASQQTEIDALTKKYPKGIYAIFIGDKLMEVHEESLSDHWTFTRSPISRFIHADPVGKPIVPIQESTNELYDLTSQTIEHGVPATYVDSTALDFDKYQDSRVAPGMIYPVRKRPGQSIADSFYQLKTATLSKEIDIFRQRLDSDSQFLIGVYPSVYGGSMPDASDTLGEYQISGNKALQRLQLHWNTITHFWANLMRKTTVDYIAHMLEDEKFVEKQGNTFVNVWIRRAEMEGRVGSVEPETNEAFPLSWIQKRDLFTKMIQLQNPEIGAIMGHPENIGMIAQIMGTPEIYIPGDDDRDKQLIELRKLSLEQPMPGGEQFTGVPGQMMPSVMPDMDVDNHGIHIEIAKAYLVAEEGRYLKQTNPPGYENCLLHLKAHMMMLSALQPPPMEDESKPKDAKKPKSEDIEPISS